MAGGRGGTDEGCLFTALIPIATSEILLDSSLERAPSMDGKVKTLVGRNTPKSVRFWIVSCVVSGLCVVPSIMYWNAYALERAIRHSTALQPSFSTQLTGVTCLRVWGAGERQARDSFCHCARVPRPERILYETKTPAEIADFASSIRVRPFFTLPPDYYTCSTITVDFLRGDEIAVSFHLLGTTLRSWGESSGRVPITKESYDLIEGWLKQRGIRERLENELLKSGIGQ